MFRKERLDCINLEVMVDLPSVCLSGVAGSHSVQTAMTSISRQEKEKGYRDLRKAAWENEVVLMMVLFCL